MAKAAMDRLDALARADALRIPPSEDRTVADLARFLFRLQRTEDSTSRRNALCQRYPGISWASHLHPCASWTMA